MSFDTYDFVFRRRPRLRRRQLSNVGSLRYDGELPRFIAGWRKMEPFRVLEHTADVGFEAFGASREEVFANAARALTDLMVDSAAIVARDTVRLRAEGADRAGLLVNWLSEILYLWETEHWLFRKFEVQELSDRAIQALAVGEKFDAGRHRVKTQVKAITYHQLRLERDAEGWRARVYVDI